MDVAGILLEFQRIEVVSEGAGGDAAALRAAIVCVSGGGEDVVAVAGVGDRVFLVANGVKEQMDLVDAVLDHDRLLLGGGEGGQKA